MRLLTGVLTLALLVTASATPADASSVTVDGINFDLQILGLKDPAVPAGAYNFQLTLLDATGYVPAVGQNESVVGTDYLTGFAVDFGTTIASATLTAPAAGWTTTTGGINTTGCQNGPNDTLCAATALTSTVLDTNTYTWLFWVDFSGDGDFAPPSTFTLQALIGGQRLKNGRTSAYSFNSQNAAGTLAFTPPGGGDVPIDATVPEPASLLLLGSGLLLAVSRLRRRA